MFTIYIALLAGIFFGWLTRRSPSVARCAALSSRWIVFFLLFSLGLSLGKNASLLEQSFFILQSSFLLCLGSTLGSAFFGFLFYTICTKKSSSVSQPSSHTTNPDTRGRLGKTAIKNSLCILVVFGSGVWAGATFFPFTTQAIDHLTEIILHLLLFSVGMEIGLSPHIWRSMSLKKGQIFLIPLGAVAGSLAGGFFASLFLSDFTVPQVLAASCGFAYYSLSSILISAHGLPLLGTISLLCNLFRELGVIIFMGLLLRIFKAPGVIAAGGAASMDTILPFITQQTNAQTAILSIINGTILSLLVPFLVPFLLSF